MSSEAAGTSGPLAHLFEFGPMTSSQLDRAIRIARSTAQEEDYLGIPYEGVMHHLEDLLGLTMDELGALLLRLAQADREGQGSIRSTCFPNGSLGIWSGSS